VGYDVHITRATDWWEADETSLSLNEWLAYVEQDPEMRREEAATVTLPGGNILSAKRPGLAVWLGYSRNRPGTNMAWFDYREGCVVVKNPDAELLTKMKRIAVTLNARVQGDEGELY
jgi:hypothetical protein